MIPISKATNAYELLEEVAQLILAEPKRYNQKEWFLTKEKFERMIEEDYFGYNKEEKRVAFEEIRKLKIPQGLPECGTVGCRAGWVVRLVDGEVPAGGMNIEDRAAEILGIDRYQREPFFSAYAIGSAPQTTEHALEGAAGIREFMEKYKDQLLARPVRRSNDSQ